MSEIVRRLEDQQVSTLEVRCAAPGVAVNDHETETQQKSEAEWPNRLQRQQLDPIGSKHCMVEKTPGDIGHENIIFFSDAGCTTVVEHIWNREWETAEYILSHDHSTAAREYELPCFPFRDSYGLPLHLACIMRPLPPATFLKTLIDTNPQALNSQQSKWGFLPIHLVSDLSYYNIFSSELRDSAGEDFSGSDLDGSAEAANHAVIVKMLLLAAPNLAQERETFNGMLPIHIAASTARSKNYASPPAAFLVLQILLGVAPHTLKVVDRYGDTPVSLAWRNTVFQCSDCGHLGSLSCLCDSMPAQHVRFRNPLLQYPNDDVADQSHSHCNFDGRDERILPREWDAEDERVNFDSSEESSIEHSPIVDLTDDNHRGKMDDQFALSKRAFIELRQAQEPSAATTSREKGSSHFGKLICQSSERHGTIRGHGYQSPGSASSPRRDTMKRATTTSTGSSSSSHQRAPLTQQRRRMGPAHQEIVVPTKQWSINFQVLRIQIELSGLQRPKNSKRPSRAPNPYFEIYVTDGVSIASRYLSRPFLSTRGGIWDEALIDVSPSRKREGTQHQRCPPGPDSWKIGVRVLHSRKNREDQAMGIYKGTMRELQETITTKIPLQNDSNVVGWLRVIKLSLVSPSSYRDGGK